MITQSLSLATGDLTTEKYFHHLEQQYAQNNPRLATECVTIGSMTEMINFAYDNIENGRVSLPSEGILQGDIQRYVAIFKRLRAATTEALNLQQKLAAGVQYLTLSPLSPKDLKSMRRLSPRACDEIIQNAQACEAQKNHLKYYAEQMKALHSKMHTNLGPLEKSLKRFISLDNQGKPLNYYLMIKETTVLTSPSSSRESLKNPSKSESTKAPPDTQSSTAYFPYPDLTVPPPYVPYTSSNQNAFTTSSFGAYQSVPEPMPPPYERREDTQFPTPSYHLPTYPTLYTYPSYPQYTSSSQPTPFTSLSSPPPFHLIAPPSLGSYQVPITTNSSAPQTRHSYPSAPQPPSFPTHRISSSYPFSRPSSPAPSTVTSASHPHPSGKRRFDKRISSKTDPRSSVAPTNSKFRKIREKPASSSEQSDREEGEEVIRRPIIGISNSLPKQGARITETVELVRSDYRSDDSGNSDSDTTQSSQELGRPMEEDGAEPIGQHGQGVQVGQGGHGQQHQGRCCGMRRCC